MRAAKRHSKLLDGGESMVDIKKDSSNDDCKASKLLLSGMLGDDELFKDFQWKFHDESSPTLLKWEVSGQKVHH